MPGKPVTFQLKIEPKLHRLAQLAAAARVTTDQIEQLRTEAGEAGDLAQVALCDRALSGEADAMAECAAVIAAADQG